MDLIISICIGILLAITVALYRQITKVWRRVNVLFDSIFTCNNRINTVDDEIDKLWSHITWCQDQLNKPYPTPEDFSQASPEETTND